MRLRNLDGLNDVVKDVIEIIRPETTMSRTQARHGPRESSTGGPGRSNPVQQAIINLALNAIDAMRRVPRLDAELSISTARSNDGVAELAVADSGGGIPADKLNAIFETYYTTKRLRYRTWSDRRAHDRRKLWRQDMGGKSRWRRGRIPLQPALSGSTES